MYSVLIRDEQYNSHIYQLSLKTENIRCLYQLGIDINTFLNHMPNMEELCLFFTVCLQSNDMRIGEEFIDNFLSEHSIEDLIGIIPHFFAIELSMDVSVNDVDSVPSEPQDEPVSVIKILDEYLKECMVLGLTESEFNSMTLAEIKRYIDVHEQRRLRELKEEAMIQYIACDLIGISVARLLSKEAKYPSFTDAFANLFTQEELERIEEEKERQRREAFLERFKAMAKVHNEKVDLMEEYNKDNQE